MRPAALLGIALELIEELARAGALPADARVGKFWRARRYLGSTDRRAIGAAAYAWLRHAPRASARWNAWVAGDRSPPAARRAFQPRQARLAEVLVLAADGLFPWSFRETAAAARELAPPAGEPPGFWGPVQDLLAGDFLDGDPWPAEPGARLAAELSLPAWLARRLVEERGEEEARRLGLALLERAPLDLRVNLRCASREEARRSLEAETGVTVAPTPHSPLGLRLQERANIAGAAAVRRGWIEVEDEGSQLVAQALDPVPGTTVIDACAGAGGKTLALADILLRAGDPTAAGAAAAAPRLFACDTAAAKLVELRRRARLAGAADAIVTLPIAASGPLPPGLPAADLVLVDAPCSGLGTLRRNPELKLRYGPGDVAAFARLELEILERFAPLVKTGGVLAYATCSLLAAENEAVAGAFGSAHAEFEERASQWARERLPPACLAGPRLRLDPLRSGTDGFFLAMWRRRTASATMAV